MAAGFQAHRGISVVAVAGLMAASVFTGTSASGSPSVSPASSTPPSTTYAVIKTIGVGAAPTGIAIDSADDTVYVANYGSGNVSVINGFTGLLTDDTIPVGVGTRPLNLAVNEADDTVYIADDSTLDRLLIANLRTGILDDSVAVASGSGSVAVNQIDDTVYAAAREFLEGGTSLAIIDGRTQSLLSPVTVGLGPFGVAVNNADDTVYVANSRATTISVVNGITGSVSTINNSVSPTRIAVNQNDDTVYVTNRGNGSVPGTVSIIDGATNTITGTVTVGRGPESVAVDQVDDTVFVVNRLSNNVSVINGRTGIRTDDTITVGSSPYGVAIDGAGANAGLIYVSNSGAANVSVIGRVTPSTVPASGDAGDTFVMTLTVPNLAPGFEMDDATVASVSFDLVNATVTPAAGNTWTITVPAGTIGSTVPVTVEFNGGLTASAGTFTYAAPTPPPTPVFPPSAPTNVEAVPGDASSSVSWNAPSDSGSFPVTNYRAVAQPGGASCLAAAPATSCVVAGLTNGEPYRFTVEALNGAGWGAMSAPSSAVTPVPAMVELVLDQGTRVSDGRNDRIRTTGSSVNVPAGVRLTPYIRYSGQSSFSRGKATIIVQSDGTFRWTRLIRKNRGLSAYVSWEDVNSNRVFWARLR